MSNEVVVAGVAASVLVGSSVAAGAYYYTNSFSMAGDDTFNFELYPYRVTEHQGDFGFNAFGFDSYGKCAESLLLVTQPIIYSSINKQDPTQDNSSSAAHQQLEPGKACLMTDIVYSKSSPNSMLSAKFEMTVIDADEKNAVLVWTGLSNMVNGQPGIRSSQRMLFLGRDDKNKEWSTKYGYEFDQNHSDAGSIVFEGLEGWPDKKLTLQNPCKSDSKCPTLPEDVLHQKKGFWTWTKSGTNGRKIMEDFPLKVKIGDSYILYFLGKDLQSIKQQPFKESTSKGNWSWGIKSIP